MAGKGYASVIRTHKLTLQGYRLFGNYSSHSSIRTWMGLMLHYEPNSQRSVHPLTPITLHIMVDKLTTGSFRDVMKGFAAALVVVHPNAEFWWYYITMVSILLCFIREQLDGSWDLHLYAFKRMLSFLFRYGHVNYAIWVTVYLADMSVLPPEVLHEFQDRNFGGPKYGMANRCRKEEWWPSRYH